MDLEDPSVVVEVKQFKVQPSESLPPFIASCAQPVRVD